MKKTKTPYNERDDLKKIESQWNKLAGLHSRKEWSASIIRAATAAEIAANLVIREEFRRNSQFDNIFIDSLLRWANGLDGKMNRIIQKFPSNETRKKELKSLYKQSEKLNLIRNDIVHSGQFANSQEAREAETIAREFIEGLISPYHPDFKLKPLGISQKSFDEEITEARSHKRSKRMPTSSK
jgi:hypothetical protein